MFAWLGIQVVGQPDKDTSIRGERLPLDDGKNLQLPCARGGASLTCSMVRFSCLMQRRQGS